MMYKYTLLKLDEISKLEHYSDLFLITVLFLLLPPLIIFAFFLGISTIFLAFLGKGNVR